MRTSPVRLALPGLLATALALACFCAQASAAFPGENGKILWSKVTYDGSSQVGFWRMDPDGTNKMKLNGGYREDLSVSADGSTLAYGDFDGIHTSAADGSNDQLIKAGNFSDPAFTPDGRIIYVAATTIEIMNADGTASSSLGVPGIEPEMSPDGTQIVFSRPGDAEEGAILIMDADGTNVETISDNNDSDPSFSPDGTKIAFTSYRGTLGPDSFTRGFTMNTDGSNPSLILSDPSEEAEGLRYSPDGTKIVFLSYSNETFYDDVATVPAGGGTFTVLDAATDEPLTTDNRYPVWQPKVDKIVVNESGDESDADDADDRCDTDASTSGLQCTLRAAIETANAKSGADKIVFDIPSADGRTIAPATELPAITEEVSIDGFTQPSTTDGEPGIYLDGASAGSSHGIKLEGADSTVKGLDVHGFQKTGIIAAGSGGHTISGNWIGLEEGTGTPYAEDGNGSGIDVRAEGITIGGTTVAERNVISANGNPDGLQAYIEGLDGSDVPQGTLHDAVASLGTGIVISDGDASTVTITGNWIGPDPGGGRFGESDGLTSTIGVFVGPEAGISTGIQIGGVSTIPGTGAGNVITGNVVGVLAAPDPATVGVVDGLTLEGNLIGADPDGSAGAGFGGVIGMMVLDHVSNLQVGGPGDAANRIQGQVMGLVAAKSTARIQGNLIGVDESIDSLASDIDGGSFGLHNLFGVMLADTDGGLIGGSTPALGNKVVGNIIGITLTGDESANNAVLANTIGLSQAPDPDPYELENDDLGSFIGVLTSGTDNDLGDPGAGNLIQGNGFGVLDEGSAGGHLQANVINGNLFGYFGTQVSDRRFGGSGSGEGNAFTSNLLGLWMLGWAPTEEELKTAHASSDQPVREADRTLAFDAEASQGPLNLVEATSTAPDASQAVALGDPPGGGTTSFAGTTRRGQLNAGPPRAAASSGSALIGNRFGLDAAGEAPNVIGAWLAGTHTDYEIRENTIAHNYGGGLWVGTPVALGSSVPEPSDIRIQTNRIFDNFSPGRNLAGFAALGVDLLEPKPKELFEQSLGVTPNDPADTDSGANGRQNFPVIDSAVGKAGGEIVISGNLPSMPNQSYEVELFANERCNAFGSGEGQIPLGSGPFTVTADSAGNAGFAKTVALPAGVATKISAAATGPEGTSEFSPCTDVAADAPTPTDPDDPDPDRTAPRGNADPKGKNKAGGPTTVEVTSSEDGTVTATGTQQGSASSGRQRPAAAALTFVKHGGKGGKKKKKKVKVKLAKAKTKIQAGQTKKLTLKINGKKAKRAAKKLKKVVKRGGVAKAKLKVVFADEAGNKDVEKLKLRLK